jgi:hypothetical protein
MADGRWLYPPELREALARHGLAPTPDTPPAVVRGAVNQLYRYGLRRLRLLYLEQQIDKPTLHARVIALRKEYWVLSLPLEAWERITRPSAP